MAGIVLELQQDALNPAVTTSQLLRKALVVARKLAIAQFEAWVLKELDGYGLEDECPPYRQLHGQIQGKNPYHGWQPVLFNDAKAMERLSTKPCSSSIAELEALVAHERSSDRLLMGLDAKTDQALRRAIGFNVELAFVVGGNAVAGILGAVRNIILKWALKLEQDGIVGEGLTFSPKEKQDAAQAATSYNVNNFYGAVHAPQIQQAGAQAAQLVIGTQPDLRAIGDVVQGLLADAARLNLSKEAEQELRADIAALQTQLSSPRPKMMIVKESLASLRRILEAATGKVAADWLGKLDALSTLGEGLFGP